MRRLASVAPALPLLAYGVAFGMRALGTGPPAFDDHPGQLARLVHALDAGPAPWAWHAGWWGGYPELQFYPPGWFYAGSVLSWLAFGALSPRAVYQALVWVTWLAPGVTAYLLLHRLLGRGWLALPGAFLVLTFAGDPAGGSASGVEGGVHIGMVAARLAWALLPLLALTLVANPPPLPRVSYRTVALLAGIVLTHPSHAPAALAILAGAVLVAPARARAARGAAGAVGLALLLVAFWALPLAWRLEHTRALAWGTLSVGALASPFGLVVIALALLAVAAPVARGLGHAAGLGVLAVAADALVAEPLGLRFLPADRVADGVWMIVLLVAGLGLGRAAAAASRRVAAPVAALATTLVLVVGSLPTSALMLWPRSPEWPALPAIERGLRLDALWAALRDVPAGRVLFVRSSVPLTYGEAWYRPHTHVTALTPMLAGRDILGGTFTHGSPVAALLYRGDTSPAPITRLAEQLDGVALLGYPLERLDPAVLDRVVDRFHVAVIVALDDDAPKLAALDASPRYRRVGVPPFRLFVAREPPAPPARRAPARWRVTMTGSEWASTGLAYYPLWRAEQDGRTLATRRGPDGALEVKPDRPGAVELAYGPGPVELVGLGLSVATAAALAGAAWRRRRRAHFA